MEVTGNRQTILSIADGGPLTVHHPPSCVMCVKKLSNTDDWSLSISSVYWSFGVTKTEEGADSDCRRKTAHNKKSLCCCTWQSSIFPYAVCSWSFCFGKFLSLNLKLPKQRFGDGLWVDLTCTVSSWLFTDTSKMSRLCDIYCPDCGQGFPLKHDHQKQHSRIQKDQSDDPVFKKPTILTKVMKTIWKPFGNTAPTKSSGGFVPVPVTHQNGFLKPIGSGGLKRREAGLRHQPYPHRRSDDRSEVGSQTGSWISSIFNFTKYQKKEEQKSAVPSNPVLRRPSCSGNYSSPYSLPYSQPQYHSFQEYDDENSLCTEDDMEEDEEDDDADSDRNHAFVYRF